MVLMALSGISIILVLIQFFCLGVIGLTGPIIAESPLLLIIEISGLGLGVWAVLAMRIGNFHIAPDPLRGSQFVQRGPYNFIRHPMYLALLLTTLPLIISDPTPGRIGVWILLVADLLVKIQYEEGLLLNRFSDYSHYQKKTDRLIPGLY
jgi:protein-S-isoprenylcysteine O-methyltransferase Ste14